MNTVVCIGDSLTYGMGWINNSSPTKPLNVRLSEKYPGIKFVNLGVNGELTANIEARKTGADNYNPFRVIVWAGINDVYFSTAYATIETNLQSIYTYYKAKGYEVWALTITSKDDNSSAQNTIRDTVNNWIKNTATGVDRVIDVFTIIADPNDTTKRLAIYADANTTNHINEVGLAAIVSAI